MNAVEDLVRLYCEFEKSASIEPLAKFQDCLCSNVQDVLTFLSRPPEGVCKDLDEMFEKYKKEDNR